MKAAGNIGQRFVDRCVGPEGCLGFVYYELPLNGEWSDLTANFRIERKGKDRYLVLEEIHVM
ncbi:hypothetical protein GCM10023116_26860 [Kistimonas scapharcae]|uniref:Uncharacterized protein n=1 Tax=Kistimonas scapharcae TaxID=1036133 RepID=A0ABP8V2E7_9GAMM